MGASLGAIRLIAIKRRDAETMGLGVGSMVSSFGAARQISISIHHASTWNIFWALFWIYGLISLAIRDALRKEAA